jgi:hypothetical protein
MATDDESSGLFEENEDALVSMEALGLQLDFNNVEFGTPTELILVVKVVQGGEFGYRMCSTPGLQSVEAMGMMRWGQLLLEEGIIVQARAPEDKDEEEMEDAGPEDDQEGNDE